MMNLVEYYRPSLPFSESGMEAISEARQEARRRGQYCIDGVDIFVGVVREDITRKALFDLGIDPIRILSVVESLCRRRRSVRDPYQEVQLTSEAVRIIQRAESEAKRDPPGGITSTHLLRGLILDEEGSVAGALAVHGLNKKRLNQRIPLV